MSTMTSQSSTEMAYQLDERKERAELRAEVPTNPSMRVIAIERAVHAKLLERHYVATAAECFLITDQAFVYARRWVKGDSIDGAASRIVSVLNVR
jgi:hypothetical protein